MSAEQIIRRTYNFIYTRSNFHPYRSFSFMRSTFTDGTSGRTRGSLLAVARSWFRRSRDSGKPLVVVVGGVVAPLPAPSANAAGDAVAARVVADSEFVPLPLLLLLLPPPALAHRSLPNREGFAPPAGVATTYCWCSCGTCTGAARSLSAESAEASMATTTNPSLRCTY